MIVRPVIFKYLIVAGLAMLTYTVKAQQNKEDSNIKFVPTNFKSALKLATQKHKLIFLDAYTTWCAPCMQMKREVFSDKKLSTYFNSHFVNFSVDVEKGEGVALAEKYDIESYPTLLFLDGQGKLIKKIEGYTDAKALYAIGLNLN